MLILNPKIKRYYWLNKKDGESGYPGEVKLTVTIKIVDSSVCIDYKGVLVNGEETIFGVTNHSYWNLDESDDIRQ